MRISGIVSILVAAWLVACGGDNTRYTVTASTSGDWSSGGVHALVVRATTGEIDVVAVPGANAVQSTVMKTCWAYSAAEAETLAVALPVDQFAEGGTVTVSAERAKPRTATAGCRVNVRVTAPPGLFVDAYARFGDVAVAGINGGARVAVHHGNAVIDRHEGSVAAAVDIGSIELRYGGLDKGEVALLSVGFGTIDVTLPAETSATFDAFTHVGKVEVVGFTDVAYTTAGKEHKAGTIGAPGEGGTLIARTPHQEPHAGNITITAAERR